jgi:hypothetical protein
MMIRAMRDVGLCATSGQHRSSPHQGWCIWQYSVRAVRLNSNREGGSSDQMWLGNCVTWQVFFWEQCLADWYCQSCYSSTSVADYCTSTVVTPSQYSKVVWAVRC